MKKIHVIPHTHWDKEWYFTASRSKIYLCKYVKDIIETLQNNTDFTCFTLDGQSSLIEDYLRWCPEDQTIIKDLVSKKRLLIGPWYTQSDQMIISGESIIRNLYYGSTLSEAFGSCMKVGYVPDSFGQAGNMPQIYRSFHIEDTLFWRGVTDEQCTSTDFLWEGDDGTTVLAKQIPFSYALGGKIPENEKDAVAFWEQEALSTAAKGCATEHVYFPQGSDQFPIRRNLTDLLKAQSQRDNLNVYVISNPQQYFDDVRKAEPALETLCGELILAKHCRVHKSIFSSRSDIKMLNTEIQNYITNILEPMMVISYKTGNLYPHKILEEIWKLMFENAAHDSAGSCCSDPVNEEIYMRYKKAKELSLHLVELHSRLIAARIQREKQCLMSLTLFNTLPVSRSGIVEVTMYTPEEDFALYDSAGNLVEYTVLSKRDMSDYILAQTIRLNPSEEIYRPDKAYLSRLAVNVNALPAFGYEGYTIDFKAKSRKQMEHLEELKNEYYRIHIHRNGALSIFDKKTGVLYENQCIIVDSGDDGDSFNYSPPRNDCTLRSDCDGTCSDIRFIGNSMYQKASFTIEMLLPYDLIERAHHICSKKICIQVEVILKQNCNVIDFHIALENTVLSHRMSVLFDAGIKTNVNYADQQFGVICRPNQYEKEMAQYIQGLGIQNHAKDQNLAALDASSATWSEPPIAIEPMQSYAALYDGTSGVAVLPKGVREYEITGDNGNLIRLTLFRSYGVMGKSNLVYRPGRASGESVIETKDAQLLKFMEFQFGFTSFDSDMNQANLGNRAKLYNTPVQYYHTADFLNGRSIFTMSEEKQYLDEKCSFMETSGKAVISAIKKWEHGEGIIVRLYNGYYQKELTEELHIAYPFEAAYVVDSYEHVLEQLPVTDHCISLKPLTHCRFITVLIR